MGPVSWLNIGVSGSVGIPATGVGVIEFELVALLSSILSIVASTVDGPPSRLPTMVRVVEESLGQIQATIV